MINSNQLIAVLNRIDSKLDYVNRIDSKLDYVICENEKRDFLNFSQGNNNPNNQFTKAAAEDILKINFNLEVNSKLNKLFEPGKEIHLHQMFTGLVTASKPLNKFRYLLI